MNKRKDFSEIAHLLSTNGVGFVNLEFKSNQTPEDLNDNTNEKKWIVDFSDGWDYLGSLEIDPKKIGFTSADWKGPEAFTITSYDVPCDDFDQLMKFEFIFLVPYTRGACFISLPDDYSDFDDE